MTKLELVRIACEYTENSSSNHISNQTAIAPEVSGMKIFDAPIFGFAKANDELFEKMKDPSIIGDHFLSPKQWLSDAHTVVSFFLPFTDAVKTGNAKDPVLPSAHWLHGRIEGQKFIIELCLYLQAQLTTAGYASVVPTADKRFCALLYTSNWSERHAAFVCGLGTFSLSKGMITKKGVAGRFGSLITNLDMESDSREYDGVYEYCSNCGKCITQCPVKAISFEHGKDHQMCSEFLDRMLERYKPRYGCGKCQVNVPCESRIPGKN